MAPIRSSGKSAADSGVPATASVPRDPLSDAVERLLRAGIGTTALAIGQVHGSADLTLSQWRTLVIAFGLDGIRVGELAGRLGISVPSASRLVRRVEDRGLLTATRDDGDRRATIVRPTRAGRNLIETVMARRRALVSSALDEPPRIASEDAARVLSVIADRLDRYS
jgi:DNA-binding MarR family transcriptional regulator